MKVLGITGGVGAGKSTVLLYLQERHGAVLLSSDEIARELETPGHDCFDEIAAFFGKGVLTEEGLLDRRALAEIVFSDPEKLELLGGIVHPAVKAEICRQLAQLEKEECPLAVLESALLLEKNYDALCDEVWYIYADEAVRIRRLQQDRGYSEEKSRAVMGNQMSDGEFRARCQIVIDNSRENVQNTYGQIDAALQALMQR